MAVLIHSVWPYSSSSLKVGLDLYFRVDFFGRFCDAGFAVGLVLSLLLVALLLLAVVVGITRIFLSSINTMLLLEASLDGSSLAVS